MLRRLERKSQPIAPRHVFFGRMFFYFLATVAIVTVSLGIGTVGYHYLGDCGWVDAFYNASMILTGMGPVCVMTTTGGKLFASFYALFSGIAFLSINAILMAPIVHRFLHRLHLDPDELETSEPSGQIPK